MKPKQLSFPPRGRGGRRPGAGRKRGRKVWHHGREFLPRPVPLHVVWRTRADVRSLRGKRLFRQIRESFRRCCQKAGFRLVHFSVQGTHVHLIVEADTREALSRGMQGLGVSIAKRINITSARSGPVFEERYFARRLATPRVVAIALDYVLHNEAHHLRRMGLPPTHDSLAFTSLSLANAHLSAPPATWLLRTAAVDPDPSGRPQTP
jgi:REP element-mobilizing transposase RayT